MKDRRHQIIDAATVLIARQGFQQTSVDDVIREAKLCGKGHFYHHFRSKEELGFAVLDRQFERFAEEGLTILRDPVTDPLERLDRFIDSVVARQAERGCAGGCPFGNLAVEMADCHEGFRQRLAAVFERWAGQIEALLWEAGPRLKEGTDGGRLARFIIATIEGALLMARLKRDVGALEDIAAELKRFVASQVRGDAVGAARAATWGSTAVPRASAVPR